MTDRNPALEITSFANPKVKAVRALAMKKERERTGLFVAEGLKLVADAVLARWALTGLFHTAEAHGQRMFAGTLAAAQAAGAEIVQVSPAVMAKIARRDNPQTVLGVFRQRRLALADLDRDRQTTLVALEAVKDPGNLGTIIRTADAASASAIVLLGETTDPFGLDCVRATMGSIFALPIVDATLPALRGFASGLGAGILGAHLGGAVDYRTAPWREPQLVLMGTEKSGLSDDAVAICDHLVKIPMAGQADSLNLAIATGIVLFEARRAQLTLNDR